MSINARNLDLYDKYGRTQLMTAIYYLDLEKVKTLIDAGADVNLKNGMGMSAVMIVSGHDENSLEMANILINAGSDINLRDNDGWTALMIASVHCSWGKNASILNLLINTGSDINHKNNHQQTPLIVMLDSYGCTDNKFETAKILVNAGCDVNCVDIRGNSALRQAIRDAKIIRLLIDAGADVNLKYINDQTFLMLLLQKENIDDKYTDVIIELLYISKKTLCDIDTNGKTAYDYYIENNWQILDKYQLKILKGDIMVNNIKSARNNHT